MGFWSGFLAFRLLDWVELTPGSEFTNTWIAWVVLQWAHLYQEGPRACFSFWGVGFAVISTETGMFVLALNFPSYLLCDLGELTIMQLSSVGISFLSYLDLPCGVVCC